jgi:serine/threonine-protein kinase
VSTNRLKQVEEILHAALEIPPAGRESFFNECCSEDVELRREVESLLAFEENSDDFLNVSPESLAAEMFAEREEQTSLIDREIGHYKIKEFLGKGGMGEVFLADDTKLERLVALKVLPIEVTNDLERIKRFVREAKAVSALNHPNIITIYEIGKTNDTHFIATEYIEGETLHSRLSSGQMNIKSVLDMAIQTAGALDAAHRTGIVHRDIKPENIMIRPDGFVKILDFGIAKLIERHSESADGKSAAVTKGLTHEGMIVGTASYMSPEQARGKDTDTRSDIFSFGVVLYEMLTGKQPFKGESAIDTISSIISKEPLPLNQLAPDIPSELNHIVEKSLRKDREERYQTAKDLLIDLKDVRQDLEFQNKLERTASPSREESKAQILSETTGNAPHTTSSAEYIVNEIKSHKPIFTAGLMILLLAFVGLGYLFFTNRSANATQIESIAVLPFENQNLDTEYLSDGLTESIINSLTKLPNLRVISRNSVFRYKGKETDSIAVGQELNVRAVLTGRIVQRGDNLIISAELTDLQDNKQIWGQQYNRKETDAFALQQEVSRNISETLREQLTGEQQQRLTKRETDSPEAYQLYLKGRYHWNKRTAADVRKSVDYFQQAIDKDPTYALAYAGLADAYILIPSYSGGSSKEVHPNDTPDDTYSKAKAAAMKALEIDENLSEAHAALATVMYEYEGNLAQAEREFKRAIEINPNYATAHQWYAECLLRMGRNEEAITEIKRAQELDPLSLIINSIVGVAYMENRQYDQATEQLRKTIEMDSNFSRAHMFLAQAYERTEVFEEAILEHEKRFVLDGTLPEEAARKATALREAYRKSGAKGYWRKQIEMYENGQTSWTLTRVASFYAQLGESDQAFALLEKAYEKRQIRNLKSPIFDPIRSDPRFQNLLHRIGLSQ